MKRNAIATVLLLSAAAATSSAPPVSASPASPPPDAQVKKELLQLRGKLLGTPRAEARAGAAKFRALCDAHGYPLVGNVAAKGDVYQPSELCSDVRKSERS